MNVAAVVLAAGMSRRMGAPKLVLPWGQHTVIEQVVKTLQIAGLETIVVVTGGTHEQVEAALSGLEVRCAFNSAYAEDDMAISLQTGLAALPEDCPAALVALGDQPQMESRVARQVRQAYEQAYEESRPVLVAPSYEMRRGHPWIIDRSLWPEVQQLAPGQTLREIFTRHAAGIRYVEVDTPTILRDLDTPEDYRREKPEGS